MPPRRRRDVALSEARVGRSSSVGLSAREAYVLLSHSQQSATAYVGAATVEILRTTSAPATPTTGIEAPRRGPEPSS